jgi:type VI secretion system protein ImpL
MIWLAIVLALLTAALWVLVILLEWPLWIAIVFTVVAILTIVTWIVVRRVRASMKAAALERELLKQAAAQADKARPDRRAEIMALQTQMKNALDALKRTKLGSKGGRAALYALPWYVIVGPPAAGKTTALTQSGLGFIAPPGSSGAKVRGTAGTRNCDWWFSERAILLDTAGRLATGEDDRDEWLSFLDTVKRFRTDRPLDGLIVAVSAEDLLSKSEVDLEELAKTLRSRADELMGRLEMVLPIYVLTTKIDLVAGFVEFCGDLTKAQRAQAFGASFSLDTDLEDPAPAIENEFDLLVRVLHARMLERLAGEPLAEVRSKILQFPVEFHALRQPLTRFTEELCRPNPYQETPLLRGFYFASGTQTGRAIDRVLDNMARGFNLAMPAAGQAMTAPPQSYFITELFQRVIFPDRHLAVRSMSQVRRKLRRQIAVVSIALLGTLTMILPAALAYVENSKLVRSTTEDIEDSQKLERTPNGGAAATAASLDLLMSRVQKLEQANGENQVRAFWGPYTAPPMYTALKGVYLERLRSLVSGPVQTQLVGDVAQVGDLTRMDATNFQAGYDDLKLYLMLCYPEHLQNEWATQKLATAWARALRSETETDKDKLQLHAGYYVAALAADKAWAWTPDKSAIARAQGRLSMVPLDELHYGWLVEAAKGAPPVRPENIFIGGAAPYWDARNNVAVPGMYTALGWQKVKALLESPDTRFDIEPWVLGRSVIQTDEVRSSNLQRLQELYFQRYGRAWQDFIGALSVKAPTDMNSAIEELRALSETEGPYVRLFKVIGENMRLPYDSNALLDKALGKGAKVVGKKLDQALNKVGLGDAGVGAEVADAGEQEKEISPVEKQFQPLLRFGFGEPSAGRADVAPSGLSQYLAQLTNLEVSLTQLEDSREEVSKDFNNELARTASAVRRLLGGIEPRTRLVLEPLLMNPIKGSQEGVMVADYSALGEHWKAEVWDIYAQKIAPRYPFADVPSDVTIPEFAEFFRPQTGTLWKFYLTNLDSRLERSGNRFVPRASTDMPLRPDFLQCLNVAQEITDAVFGNGTEPLVPFSIKIHPVGVAISEISFIVDGKPTIYRNEPERWLPVQWPGKAQPIGGILRVRGAGFTDEIPRLGDFGLFRLLAAGNLKASGQIAEGMTVLAGSWTLTRPGQPPVTLDVKPSKSVHPFSPGFFKRLRCPAQVSAGIAGPPGGRR